MTKTAKLLKSRTIPADEIASERYAEFFELSEPLEGHTHVMVSAVTVLGDPETYIFPVDNGLKVSSWGELEGSQKGTLDVRQVMTDLGYEVVV